MLAYLYAMEFLYFPEDKSEYIPSVITLVIFMIGAVVTMYLFYKKSKKDEERFMNEYKDALEEKEESSK
ncbi:MAG TPA: hypothetical protein VK119_11705 [Bacillota bacterium]|nr:hypothetical protein [Bacillota bacterium]